MSYTEHAEKIKEAIDQGFRGKRDEQALAIIQREMAFALSDPDLPGRARAKLPELTPWAEIYFSPRKHRDYVGGLDQIYAWMMEALDTAKTCEASRHNTVNPGRHAKHRAIVRRSTRIFSSIGLWMMRSYALRLAFQHSRGPNVAEHISRQI